MSEGMQSPAERASLSVRNVGGIDSAEVAFDPGVNALVGRNATNRTSLLQAVIGALGGSNVSLKGDADEGTTTLTLAGDTYTRRLRRDGESVVTSGDPLLDDPEVADLFAFLVESNEARRTVARAGDLRGLIMSPVDTDEIEAEIRQLKQRQSDIDAEIRSIDEEEEQLPKLIERRSSLEEDIEEKEAELEAIRAEIADSDVRSTGNDADEELEEKLEARQQLESTREDVVFDLQTERQSLESLQTDRDEIEAELDDIQTVSDQRLQDVRSRLNQARERQNVLESTINQMQNIIQFNEEQLEDEEGIFGNVGTEGGGGLFGSLKSEAGTDLLGALRTEHEGDQSVTDQLVDDQQILTCWTCGSRVKKARIRQMVGELRDIRTDQFDLLNEVEEEIRELKETKTELEEATQRRERLERKRTQLDREIDTRHDRIRELETRKETLEGKIDDLSAEIEQLRAEIDATEEDDYSTLLQLQEDAKQLEIEVERKQDEIDDVNTQIETIEERIERRDELEAERTELREQLTDLRQRVEQTEHRAVTEFNERMAEMLDMLDYSNIERIWIERVGTAEVDERSVSTDASFDIHVVRTTEDGSSYRDTIDHLSESEREVTGLVFALAGYLVHDVHESMPFIVLDSLEAIDSERIARLIDYLSEYADYLVVALLPEDAQALGDECHYQSPPW
jgi:DNA repair exonuclease SbcCD ATPase subunit